MLAEVTGGEAASRPMLESWGQHHWVGTARKEVGGVDRILEVQHHNTPWPGLSQTQSPGMREKEAVCTSAPMLGDVPGAGQLLP